MRGVARVAEKAPVGWVKGRGGVVELCLSIISRCSRSLHRIAHPHVGRRIAVAELGHHGGFDMTDRKSTPIPPLVTP